MVTREGKAIRGSVYPLMSFRIWGIFDRFEDPIYRWGLIEVYRSDGSKMKAHAYVFPVDQQHLSSEIRQMDWFIEEHLEGYVSRCRLLYEAIASESLSARLAQQAMIAPCETRQAKGV